jgi:hypothetical protein
MRRARVRRSQSTISAYASRERMISPPDIITVSKRALVKGAAESFTPDELSISPPPGAIRHRS